MIGRDGDWVKILLPARVGYVYGGYLTVTDAADSTASIGGMTGGSDALTPDGNLTLIDDIGTSTKAGKQFITLESKNGNTFYLIIDRDDEGEETVHFLNQVDEADLMALTGEEETPAVCSCTTKCVSGAVNTSCPVCAVNMTECVGKETKPEVPTEPTEPTAEEPEKKSGVGGILVVLLIVALGGGAAFYIFKQKKAKPQTKGSADLDDYDSVSYTHLADIWMMAGHWRSIAFAPLVRRTLAAASMPHPRGRQRQWDTARSSPIRWIARAAAVSAPLAGAAQVWQAANAGQAAVSPPPLCTRRR